MKKTSEGVGIDREGREGECVNEDEARERERE